MQWPTKIQALIRHANPTFVWTATAVGLFVNLLFFIAVARDFRVATVEINEQSIRNVAILVEQDIARNVELYDLSLQAVIDGLTNPEIMAQPAHLRQVALFSRSGTAQGLGALVVLDKNGSIVLDSWGTPARQGQFADREYFKIHRDAPNDIGLYISKPFRARLQGDVWSISFSRRVPAADGSFNGIISGTVKLDFFQKRLDELALGEGGRIGLFRDDGTLIVRDVENDDQIGTDRSKAPLFKYFPARNSGLFYSDKALDGVSRFYAFRRIADLPLVISVGLAERDVLAPWWSKVKLLAIIYLLMAASVIALVFMFVSELKQRVSAERAEAARARQDSLTKLANRFGFHESFHKEWARCMREGRPLALLILDIDHFKLFNDTYGHPEGDRVLAAVAGAMSNSTRRPGDIAARIGGEEMAVILPNTDKAGALVIARAIGERISALKITHVGSDHKVVTASIGIAAVMPKRGLDPDDLIKHADTALYEAKSKGRNAIRVSNVELASFAPGLARISA